MGLNTLSEMTISEEQRQALQQKVWQDPFYFTAFGFGLGNLPKAPGTWGSLLGILFYLVFSNYQAWQYLVIVLACFIFGVWLCDKVSRDIGIRDYPGIVWDEVVGMMLTLSAFKSFWSTIILAFILFRLFDIFKPWPISWIEKQVDGGLGIMLDDVLAGLMAWCCLFLLSLIGVIG